jgi:hypothetical protein
MAKPVVTKRSGTYMRRCRGKVAVLMRGGLSDGRWSGRAPGSAAAPGGVVRQESAEVVVPAGTVGREGPNVGLRGDRGVSWDVR